MLICPPRKIKIIEFFVNSKGEFNIQILDILKSSRGLYDISLRNVRWQNQSMLKKWMFKSNGL